MLVAGTLMAINQWVHRRERKEAAIDMDMHGKPSLSARIEAIAASAHEREKSQDRRESDRDGMLNREFEAINRRYEDINSRCFGDSQVTVRGRLHDLEDWRQSFGARTDERLMGHDREFERVQRQLDRDWRRSKTEGTES